MCLVSPTPSLQNIKQTSETFANDTALARLRMRRTDDISEPAECTFNKSNFAVVALHHFSRKICHGVDILTKSLRAFETPQSNCPEPVCYRRPIRVPDHFLLHTMSPHSTQPSIETPPRAPSPVHNFGTLAVHAGAPHDPVTGAVIESVRPPPVPNLGEGLC